MKKLRRLFFWIHLPLGVLAGAAGALMAGTAVIMAFADTYVDLREGASLRVVPAKEADSLSLGELAERVVAANPERTIQRVGLTRDSGRALEFYLDQDGLVYADPYEGKLRSSDSVPLRRSLHKGVEQWHRFFGLKGETRAKGKVVMSWFNVALVPLLVTGLVLWWPQRLRWRFYRGVLLPAGGGRGGGSQRSWHTALGFWALPFLLVMVLTATTHSFEWVRETARRVAGSGAAQPGPSDQLWAPGLPKRSPPAGATLLSLDELRAIADQGWPGWTRLDLFPAPPLASDEKAGAARLLIRAPGDGPEFFPATVQVVPWSGEVLDVHSWEDLSGGTRCLAWSRWLHKGEAFGRTGQIVAGVASLAMVVLIVTGWSMAIGRLRGRLRG